MIVAETVAVLFWRGQEMVVVLVVQVVVVVEEERHSGCGVECIDVSGGGSYLKWRNGNVGGGGGGGVPLIMEVM